MDARRGSGEGGKEQGGSKTRASLEPDCGGGTLERPPMNEPYHARSPAQKTFRSTQDVPGSFGHQGHGCEYDEPWALPARSLRASRRGAEHGASDGGTCQERRRRGAESG